MQIARVIKCTALTHGLEYPHCICDLVGKTVHIDRAEKTRSYDQDVILYHIADSVKTAQTEELMIVTAA
jgi:hypothetical protein